MISKQKQIKDEIIKIYKSEKSIWGLFAYQDLVLTKDLELVMKSRKQINKPNIVLGKEVVVVYAVKLEEIIPTFVEDAIKTVMAVKNVENNEENQLLHKEDILLQVDRIKSVYLKYLIISGETLNNIKNALFYFGYKQDFIDLFLDKEYLSEVNKLRYLYIHSEKSETKPIRTRKNNKKD